eukprot:1443620-Pleurochrysis_carterae.AAC.1
MPTSLWRSLVCSLPPSICLSVDLLGYLLACPPTYLPTCSSACLTARLSAPPLQSQPPTPLCLPTYLPSRRRMSTASPDQAELIAH